MVAHTNIAYDDQQWYADSGANAHITNDLENLNFKQPFQNDDTVAVGNGASLGIENIGSTVLTSSLSKFHLKNVLHCPNASANLLSIQKFCKDNDCYFKLTSTHFLLLRTTRSRQYFWKARVKTDFILFGFQGVLSNATKLLSQHFLASKLHL